MLMIILNCYNNESFNIIHHRISDTNENKINL